MTDLKPCPNPWCGGDAEIRNEPRRGDWWVQCRKCLIDHPARCANEAEAIAAWNQRPADAHCEAVHDALAEAHDLIEQYCEFMCDEDFDTVIDRVRAALAAYRSAKP